MLYLNVALKVSSASEVRHKAKRFKSSTMATANFTDVLNHNKLKPTSTLDGFAIPRKVLFALIAILAIVGNSLFCVVLVRKKAMLARPYNKLLLSLSVTDLLTGIVIIFTPNFILDKEWLQVPDGIVGDFYCRTIYNRMLIFLFGKASILTASLLAVERWFSILKSIKYRLTFSQRRLWASIICIWISSILLQMPKAFKISSLNRTCKFHGSSIDSQALAIMYVWITFFLPSLVIWGTFAQIRKRFQKTNRLKKNHPRRTVSQRLLGVCALAACIMTLCWIPVQITYILSRFEIVETCSILHQVNQMLAMSNSCINPWIFCLANKEYRDEFCSLMTWVFSRSRSRIRRTVERPLGELTALPIRLLYMENIYFLNDFEGRRSKSEQTEDVYP